ncbi:type I phosphomannose isomerase catalytic subunit [Alkaliflexus imshenetskii]|uniref:type I phosphomannose isomerase catalytic subunit n=1 Tax=Alkaliflexus imshenetskii TaxID=286730 RepID=UPI00047B7283|nr:type I phosphomannose isomerase catalytic subunit [Alkaliflexus imshenetskii]
MTSTQLYPLKFTPILKDRIWGGNKLETVLNKSLNGQSGIGESWELSGVDGDISVVENGFLKGNNLSELIEIYMGDLVGERVFAKFGTEFPLLIKFIDAREALSIQVHPDDKLAEERHSSFGKTEMWYVMQAEEGAQLISGFNQKVTPETYVEAVKNNTLEDILAQHKVASGDVFFMPAGRVHAIGAGILIAEIQQTSDITYRIYDFNRRDANGNSRELHTELAVDAIDYKKYDNYRTDYKPQLNTAVEVVKSPYFQTNVLEAENAVARDYYPLDSFVILICVEGEATITYGNNLHETMKIGDTILVPADLRQITIMPNGKTKILETFMPVI